MGKKKRKGSESREGNPSAIRLSVKRDVVSATAPSGLPRFDRCGFLLGAAVDAAAAVDATAAPVDAAAADAVDAEGYPTAVDAYAAIFSAAAVSSAASCSHGSQKILR